MTNKSLSTILYFIDDNFRKVDEFKVTKSDLDTLDWTELFKLARKNKVLYFLSDKLLNEFSSVENANLKKIITEGEKCFRQFRETIKLIYTIFNKEKIDFLTVKTFKDIPHITQDIDVIIRYDDHRRAAEALKKNGLSEVGTNFSKLISRLDFDTAHYGGQGLLNIDIYSGMPWHEAPTMDDAFLWSRPQAVESHGISYDIPNPEANFLSMIANNVFTNPYITLLDFLYLNSLMKSNLNFDIINGQVNKYGWAEAFSKIVSELKKISKIIYQDNCIFSKPIFPYPISLSIFLKSIFGPVGCQIKKEPRSTMRALRYIGYRCFFGRFYSNISKLLEK